MEADGAVDAQNAPTAPWKTLCVFHELPQGLSHQVTHEKLRKAPKYRWETRIDPDFQLPQLTFDNAAVRVGAAPQGARYSVRWSVLDNLSGREQPWGQIELEDARAGVPPAAWGPADDVGDRYTVAAINTVHTDYPHWKEPVVVTLRDRAGDIRVVGIERPRKDPALEIDP